MENLLGAETNEIEIKSEPEIATSSTAQFVVIQDPIAVFRCGYCTSIFSSQDEVTQHLLKQHRQEAIVAVDLKQPAKKDVAAVGVKHKIFNEPATETTPIMSEAAISSGYQNKTSQSKADAIEAILAKLKNNVYSLDKKVKSRRSIVWDSFLPILNERGNVIDNHFCCITCSKVIIHKANTTSTLLKHNCVKRRKIEDTENQKLVPIDATDKKKATLAFTNWLIEDCQPFSVVQGTGFRKMAKVFLDVAKKYEENVEVESMIPDFSTLSRNVVKLRAKHDEMLIADLKEYAVGGCGITSNLISKNLSECYLSVTVSYIKEKKFASCTLGVFYNHRLLTAADILKETERMLKRYDLDKIEDKLTMVSNHLNKNVAFESKEQIGSISHSINSVFSNGVSKCSGIVTILKEVRESVKHINKADSISPLREACQFLRLNFEILELAIKNRSQLKAELIDEKRFAFLKQLSEFFGKFKAIFDIFETSNSPTLHKVLPAISQMNKFCKDNTEDPLMLAELKQRVREGSKYFIVPEISVLHRVAVFLLPPANQLLTFTAAEKKETHDYVKKEMLKYSSPIKEEEVIVETRPSVSNSLSSSMYDDFFLQEPNERVPYAVDVEFMRYKNENYTSPPEDYDVLDFWEAKKTEFPLLYMLSRRIFSIPASIVDTERILSKVQCLNGANSSIENVNDMLVLYWNSKNIDWSTSLDVDNIEDDD